MGQRAETTVAECFLTSCVRARFKIGSYTMSAQRHSRSTPTSLGPRDFVRSNRLLDRKTDRRTEDQTDSQTNRPKHAMTNRQKNRHFQTDSQTDRQKDVIINNVMALV